MSRCARRNQMMSGRWTSSLVAPSPMTSRNSKPCVYRAFTRRLFTAIRLLDYYRQQSERSDSRSMADQISIADHKAVFIRAQVRSLNTPVKTSSAWRDIAPNLDEDHSAFSEKTVQDIVEKVNNKIRSHNRLVFSSQSQRHVAEQIDALFWNEVTAEDFRATFDATWLSQDVDLCEAESIASLPENYADLCSETDSTPSPEDVDKYDVLRRKLVELSRKRAEQAQKLSAYRHLQQLLVPFEDAQINIQPNLVTKDGELSKEFDRMRMLIARILSRADGIQRSDPNLDIDNAITTNEEKLAHVIGLG